MKYLSVCFLAIMSFLCTHAQVPPSNLYSNLAIYKSVAVYEDGEQVPFTGEDFFYLDFDNNGDVWIISWITSQNQWGTSDATLIQRDVEGSKYEGYNGYFEDIVFLISPDNRDLLLSKDGSDLVVAYELVYVSSSSHNYNSNLYPSYGGYNSGNNGSTSNSGRTCVSCNGTGKCKTCNGQGWYYHETGYYTGRSGKTKTTCPVCNGTGRCGTCHGLGSIR